MIDLEAVRAAWPMSRMLEHFGIPLGKRGLTRCPFCYHLQSTPAQTLSWFERGWHCFRCHRKGSPIDLFAQMEDLSFPDALRKLGSEYQRVGPRYTQAHPAHPERYVPFGPSVISRETETYCALIELIARERDVAIARARTAAAEGDAPPEDLPAEIAFADMHAFQLLQDVYLDHQETVFHARRICAERGADGSRNLPKPI